MISLGTGFVGYLFGDSLRARNRAEMRKATMERYFAVDNDVPGKRKQMLVFLERYLATDDPELLTWVRAERAIVDKQLMFRRRRITLLEAELSSLRTELQTMQADSAKAQAERGRTEAERDRVRVERDRLRVQRDRLATIVKEKESQLRETVSITVDRREHDLGRR